MEKDILKSALFGYSKISVCQYIATMNEEFNTKLMAETEAFREERSSFQKKIETMEAELAAYRQNACDVGSVLLEAGQYADQLRQQAREETDQLRQQTREETEEFLQNAREEAETVLQQAWEESESVLRQAREEAAELLRQTREEADQLRSQVKKETDQLLQDAKEKGDAQTKKIELYSGAIGKLREDMAVLANRTDEALHAFVEQFASMRREFEDSEL